MSKQDMRAYMLKLADFSAVSKAKMVDRKLEKAMATCPACGVKDSVKLQIVPLRLSWDRQTRRPKSPNAHSWALRWRCEADGCGAAMIE